MSGALHPLSSRCFGLTRSSFALPPIKLLLAKRVIVTSCVDASLLLSARCTNLALSRLESQVSSAIHPLLPPSIVHPHFAYFLLDEAAQASEPETAVPLAVVLTGPYHHPCRIAICGDTAQLGPAITSETVRDLEMGVSILERLGERKVYRDHPWSRRNRRRFPGVKWDVRVPCVSLVRNYRSHASILMLPSTLVSLSRCMKRADGAALAVLRRVPYSLRAPVFATPFVLTLADAWVSNPLPRREGGR